MALGLAREGAKVVIGEVREAEAKKVLHEIRSSGGTGELFIGDLSQAQFAERLIQSCAEQFGRVDILINNAGLRMEDHDDGIFESWRCLQKRLTHELPVAEWDQVLGVNLRAVFLCTHFALPHMIGRKRGTIISTSSNAGSQGVVGKSAYCASKHAVEGLMKTVAAEVREFGISANAIHPGSRANVDGRGGQPPEVVVPLVCFLAGQDTPDITGQVINAKKWNAENHG
jgi:NAD(P)-dependent dehydrogenase (short-subunit alcohol dehydrogenase family)